MLDLFSCSSNIILSTHTLYLWHQKGEYILFHANSCNLKESTSIIIFSWPAIVDETCLSYSQMNLGWAVGVAIDILRLHINDYDEIIPAFRLNLHDEPRYRSREMEYRSFLTKHDLSYSNKCQIFLPSPKHKYEKNWLKVLRKMWKKDRSRSETRLLFIVKLII